ncbi:flavodoxin family protein [Pectinatus brassicae]|uniref:Flavodoxin n=1 Tax=Pectinatus brassicae TaxID=862415 RepID=A0A840UUI1_9FIRM|nr:flavodoxin family protein [Pectinatus brassicae]MBB5336593.1 flavodoxin [Pectinatus brassicae]
MKKWLTIYSSNTGNTKQIACALNNALDDNEGDIYSINNISADFSFADYDVIMVGYWLSRGGPDPKSKKILGQLSNKEVILFQTHGAEKYSEHAVTAFARAANYLGEGCTILGTFASQGKINPALLARREQGSPDDPHTANDRNKKRWANAALHPDADDLQAAADFITAMKRKFMLRQKYLK